MNLVRIFSVATIIFFIDQITKFYVVRYLQLNEKFFISVFDPFLNFQMAWNRGINFGLFGSDTEATRIILILITFIICIMLVWWFRNSHGVRSQISVGFIIGGALGNAFDRATYGAVADFLNISCCGVTNPFSFNVADIAIFFGAIGLLFSGEEQKTEIE
ncbi:MAG: signal peptidase II [Pseudomonadota bacterium]|nr:signal peptidase II [Pseudomonadota bacterium]